jgi:hypothetical protein
MQANWCQALQLSAQFLLGYQPTLQVLLPIQLQRNTMNLGV